MGAKAMKLMMVPRNGQISIGKNWAGRQIRVEEVSEHEIRISAKFRARVCRDGKMVRFISLHPDHDSAYEEVGGEDV